MKAAAVGVTGTRHLATCVTSPLWAPTLAPLLVTEERYSRTFTLQRPRPALSV